MRTKIDRVDIEIDSNKFISDFSVSTHTINQVHSTRAVGEDEFLSHEFGPNLLFLWEFTGDYTFKRKVEIKYYAFDEILGLIGGTLSIFLACANYFILPYSENRFIIEKSAKKEEI